MIRLFKRIAARTYQSAAAWSLVFTGIRMVGNLVVLPLMLYKLKPELLGFWYVFLSFDVISGLADMGFFPTMVRVTAYIWAGASEIQKVGVASVPAAGDVPSSPNYSLLADLVKTMRLYYLALALLITSLLGILGTPWIIHKAQGISDQDTVMAAWLLFLPGVFINTMAGMWHPLLSGINYVRRNQQILVFGLLGNYIVCLVGLLLGIGLFAPVAGYLTMGLLSRTAASACFKRVAQSKTYAASARWSFALLSALWPTAWRTGVLTLGTYATLNMSTLICTAYLGVKATASFGLSLQLALAAASIASSFFTVKIPLIAQLRAQGRTQEISPIIFPRLQFFWAIYIALSLLALLLGPIVLGRMLHSKTSLIPALMFAALLVVVGLEGHHAIFRELTLTSHRNPFTKPVITSGILILLLTLISVRWIGLWALILAPGLVQLCFNNWWIVLVGLRSIGSSLKDYLVSLLSPPTLARVVGLSVV